MAKEYTVAEYGHEERRELGMRVGSKKNIQINNKEAANNRANKRRPKYQDCEKDVRIGKIKNERKRARQDLDNAIFAEEITACLEV